MNNKELARYEAGKYYRGTKHPCALCNSPNTIMHHEDYNKPLNIIWLCTTCHGQYHTNSLKSEHITHIKTLYRWFYVKKWITYKWYIDNKALYFKRLSTGVLSNTFNASIGETVNTFNDLPETLIY